MKKLAVVLMLAVVFTITLTGCSKDKGNQETTAGQVDLSSNSEVARNAGKTAIELSRDAGSGGAAGVRR